MKSIEINNTIDLLGFLKRDEVTVSVASRVIQEALKVSIIADYTKDQLIFETEHYINNYCQDSLDERPLFFTMYLPDIGNRK